MFALRPLAASARQQARRGLLKQETMQAQQKRNMSGGDDDGVHRVNWWDAPQNPNIWQRHQLAWWTAGFYGFVAWSLSGGSKEEAPKQ